MVPAKRITDSSADRQYLPCEGALGSNPHKRETRSSLTFATSKPTRIDTKTANDIA